MNAVQSHIVVSPSRKKMHGEERRRQILRVAIDTFARHGFGGTKTRAIADAAGISEAILFRHFTSKEDLYHAILDSKETEEGTAQRISELQQFAERRDDTGLLRQIASQILVSFREDPAFHRLMLYAGLEGHLLADLFHQRFGLPTGNFLRRYVALRQKEGALRKCDPTVAVMFFFGTVVQYSMARYVFGVKKHALSDSVVIDELVDLVTNGLREPRASLRRGKKNGRAK
jgi:AcrR family transcriptional regulator